MFEPILANYTPDGDDWMVEVTAAGKTLTATAPGLIAARDRADQLVEKLTPGDKRRTVVHTLEGDALEFTTVYLTARLAKPADAAPSEEATTPAEDTEVDAAGTPAENPAVDAEDSETADEDEPVTPSPRKAETAVTEATA